MSAKSEKNGKAARKSTKAGSGSGKAGWSIGEIVRVLHSGGLGIIRAREGNGPLVIRYARSGMHIHAGPDELEAASDEETAAVRTVEAALQAQKDADDQLQKARRAVAELESD